MSSMRTSLTASCAVWFLAIAPALWSQGAPVLAPSDAPRKQLPIESVLFDASRMAQDPAVERGELRTWLEAHGVPVDPAQRATALLSHESAVPITTAEWLATRGAEITGAYRDHLEIVVEPALLADLAAALPAGVRIEHPGHFVADATEGEGPTATGSASLRDAGLDGTGLTIAVIDHGFIGLSAAQAAGDAPPDTALTKVNLTFSASIASTTPHGTGSLENIYDHAPNATYRIYKVETPVDLGNAVDDAIANGVDLITHSLSWFNRGWADDTGIPCTAANTAGAAGVLFFTAAGNRANQHWQGTFTDADDDGLHEWSGGDEGLDITLMPGTGVLLWLSWDPGTGSKDYDLLLVDPSTGFPVKSSTSGADTFEFIRYVNPTGLPGFTPEVRVVQVSGDDTEIELFMAPLGVAFDLDEYAVAVGSTTSPSNATHPNVISVAAIDEDDFGSARFSTGIAMDYSGWGPTNDGMVVPDVSGPTNTVGFTYTSFGGTSCATPNAAGVAAVLWSCDPNRPAEDVRELLLDWAESRRDFGTRGTDPIYGRGGVWLPPDADCNANTTADACDILAGTSLDENLNGVIDEFLCDSLDEITFRVPPVIEPFDFFDGFAEFTIRPEIFEAPWVPGGPRPWAGFAMGLGHDPNIMTPLEVAPSFLLMQLGGGQGPDFFAPEIYTEGITVGCVFDLGNQEILTFDGAIDVLEVKYAGDPQQLAGNAGVAEGEIAFDGNVGSSPIAMELADPTGNVVTPVLEPGLVELRSKSYFEIRQPPEIVLEVDPGDPNLPSFVHMPKLVDTRAGGPAPIVGFTMAFGHDPSVLEPTAVELPGWLQALDGGNGPAFFDVQILTDRVFVQVLHNTSFGMVDPLTPVLYTTYTLSAPVVQNLTVDLATFVNVVDIPGQPPIPPGVIFDNNSAATVDHEPLVVTIRVLEPEEFVRADCNVSGAVDLSDAIVSLQGLFVQGAPEPVCLDACDANDDGVWGLGDPISLLAYLFSGGPPPLAPFPSCGEDPTGDSLECEQGLACP